MARIVWLECGCCGNARFRGVQNYNKDTGYGTCEPCQKWILERGDESHPIQVYAKEKKSA